MFSWPSPLPIVLAIGTSGTLNSALPEVLLLLLEPQAAIPSDTITAMTA